MQTPLQVTFHQVPASPALEANIKGCVEDLESICNRITSCRVSVEAPHRHKQNGRLYKVDIDLSVPGAQLVTARSPDADVTHRDAFIAVRDAFRAARRQLEHYVQRRRGE
jgi:ribosome-associated translation inhibitor RaiA